MADYDRFDDASYSTDQVEFEDESALGQVTGQVGKITPILKKNAKLIIALIAVAAIAWLAYDYFIGSIIEATIAIEDTEGTSLEDNSIKVFEKGNQEEIFKDSDSPSYSLSLRPGEYRYQVIAENYKPKNGSFTVARENPDAKIVLSKDIDVSITEFEQNFPSKLFVGSTKQFQIVLQNHADSSVSVDLVAGETLKGMLSGGTGLAIPGNSTKTFDLEIFVPKGTEVSDDETGDQKKAEIRVKYTNEKSEAGFVLFPNPKNEIKLDDARFSAEATEGKNTDDQDIEIDNGNDFPIGDLELSVEITGASKNDIEDVLSWFRFTENLKTDPEPYKIPITSIPGKEDAEKVLQVEIPLTAQKEPAITGNIVLTAPWLDEPIKRPLTLNIKKGADFGIELDVSERNPIEIDWDSALGKYKDVPVMLAVDNTGKLDIQNIVVSVANEATCNRDWLEILENNVERLAAGEDKDLAMMASAPPAAMSNQPRYCSIRYTYSNPTGSGGRMEAVKTNLIEIVPQEP